MNAVDDIEIRFSIKTSKGNKVFWFERMTNSIVHEMVMDDNIRKGIANDVFKRMLEEKEKVI